VRPKTCVHPFPDATNPGNEVDCLGGTLHGTDAARNMVEHRITHWNLSAKEAVLSSAGSCSGT
jgi:hypothetical protein